MRPHQVSLRDWLFAFVWLAAGLALIRVMDQTSRGLAALLCFGLPAGICLGYGIGILLNCRLTAALIGATLFAMLVLSHSPVASMSRSELLEWLIEITLVGAVILFTVFGLIPLLLIAPLATVAWLASALSHLVNAVFQRPTSRGSVVGRKKP